VVLGCRVGAVIDEEPCNIKMTLAGRRMECCRPGLVLGCYVGAVLDEELCDIEMAVPGR